MKHTRRFLKSKRYLLIAVENEAYACQKIVLNSTAADSWYFDSNDDAEISAE
jgi:hypothetical protein